jgi:hypothetical protein
MAASIAAGTAPAPSSASTVSAIRRKAGQRRAAHHQLLSHLFPQKPAQPRADLGQLLHVTWGNWLPSEEVLKEAQKAGRCVEIGTGRLYVTDETDK